jgi:phosphatidylglycerol:prolipoprotein diacylglycerol transferase
VRPILFSLFGLDIQSYGVSRALAALVASFLLARALQRLSLKRDSAYSLVMWATVWGFVGAKIYYLLEQVPSFDVHHLGGMGFTWYGGFIGGVVAAAVIVHRNQLPLGMVAGAAAVPLTLAYGIGRLGCLLSGDGTYGKPASLPWALTFPHGIVPSDVPVHPTPCTRPWPAIAIATLLWALDKRSTPLVVVGAYLALSGISRFLVEYLRINEPVLLGLTQPQLWALTSLIAGVVLIARSPHLNRAGRAAAQAPGADEAVSARSTA